MKNYSLGCCFYNKTSNCNKNNISLQKENKCAKIKLLHSLPEVSAGGQCFGVRAGKLTHNGRLHCWQMRPRFSWKIMGKWFSQADDNKLTISAESWNQRPKPNKSSDYLMNRLGTKLKGGEGATIDKGRRGRKGLSFIANYFWLFVTICNHLSIFC